MRGTGALPAPDVVPGLAISTGTPVVSVATKLVTHAAPAVTSPRRGSQGWVVGRVGGWVRGWVGVCVEGRRGGRGEGGAFFRRR